MISYTDIEYHFSQPTCTYEGITEVKYEIESNEAEKLLQDLINRSFELDEDEREQLALFIHLFSTQLLGNDD